MRFWMTEFASDNESVLSERLTAAKVRLTPPPSPKPEVTRRSSSGSNSSQGSAGSKHSRTPQQPTRQEVKKKKKKIKTSHNPGDAAFFRSFAPNNPELLQGHNYCRTFDLGTSDDEGEPENQMDGGAVKVSYPEPALGQTQFGGPPRGDILGHRPALSLGHYNEAPYHSNTSWWANHNPRAIGIDTFSGSRSYDDHYRQKNHSRESRSLSLLTKYSSSNQQNSAAATLLQLKSVPTRRTSTGSEAVATSPELTPFLISPAEAAPEQTLPAIVPESPRGAGFNHLPGVNEVIGLPSRQRTSSYSATNSPPATSPQDGSRVLPQPLYIPGQGGVPLTRTSTVSSHETLSPTRRSPEFVASPIDPGHYHPRRVGPRQIPLPSMPSHNHGSSSSYRSGSTSGGTSTGTSSGSEGLTPVSSNNLPGENRLEANQDNLSAKYVHYPGVPIGGYKCTFEGCDAPPFSTQYLLNSHANVHSSERPHFCPVKGCPRGEGGQGFKRKNEMIRHGLVHQSPGYLCPWCDREHRYPRPDNLQRHVSTHHKDKSRDDPQLLSVLAQRAPGGVSRGRRRRT